jgi:hypothetical protein
MTDHWAFDATIEVPKLRIFRPCEPAPYPTDRGERSSSDEPKKEDRYQDHRPHSQRFLTLPPQEEPHQLSRRHARFVERSSAPPFRRLQLARIISLEPTRLES